MIIHLDMDAFFASVEILSNPAYKGRPLIVGGGSRGVVVTASYEARVFGIHSAMPVAQARKLCPDGIFIPASHGRYSEISRKIMGRLRQIFPVVQQASIDEAYLDGENLIDQAGGPMALARTVKRAVLEVSGGLTCSIGMAPVKFLAKICSDMDKPDGITILTPEEMDSFLLGLKMEKLPGVGRSMTASLASFGIYTVAQARNLSLEFLRARYGKFGVVLYERIRGIDTRKVRENPPPKSESSERTFSSNIRDKTTLAEILRDQSRRVSESLRARGLAGRTVTLKIKFADFTQITRAHTIDQRIDDANAIYDIGASILQELSLPQPVRLLGICVSGFEARHEQLPLPGLITGFGQREHFRDFAGRK